MLLRGLWAIVPGSGRSSKHAVDQEPVVSGQRLQSSCGIGVGGSLGDVDVHADAEIGSQSGRRLQRVVAARERRVHADHPAATGADEPLVLGEAAPRPVGAVAVGDAIGAQHADADLGTRLGDHVEAALDGVWALVVVDDAGGAAQQRLDRAEARRRPQHVEIEGGIEAPPDLLEDLDESPSAPRRRRHARGRARNRGDDGRRRSRG